MLEASRDFSFAYLSILFEGAPFILVGALISGFLDIFLPPRAMEKILPKKKVPAILVAALLGLVLPICECAVVPVIRRLVQKGLPVSCGLTYMLAAPVLNPITALSTWHAFQGQEPWVMVSARLGLAYVLAVSVGLVTLRIPLPKMLTPRLVESIRRSVVAKPAGFDPMAASFMPGRTEVEKETANMDARVVAAVRSGLRDFVDVGIYFSLGVAITALFNTGIAPGAEGINRLAGGLVTGPAAMMLLAFLLSLCSTSDAFIAATLHHFSFASKLAFLTFGPLMDLKLIFLYRTVFQTRLIVALAAGLFLTILIVAVAMGILLPDLAK
jgi:uncharacterized protein